MPEQSAAAVDTPPPAANHATRNWRVDALAGLLLAAVFVTLTLHTWRKWPDVLVDYGLQLYAPWQLASGKVLYRDVAYLSGGPLSQYFHALVFRVFGASFLALILTNLSLLAGLLIVLYRLFARAGDRWTACLIGLVVLTAFAFAHLLELGNYNYIAPYVYDAVHGLMLSVLAIGCWWRWLRTRQCLASFATGLCLGGVFLTKPELFLALALALGAGAVVGWRRSTLRTAACFAAGFLLPIVGFAIYFASVWNWRQGIMAVFACWLPLFQSSIAQSAFFRAGLGLDQPGVNLLLMARSFGGFLLTLLLMALFSRAVFRRQTAWAIVCGLTLTGVLFWYATRFFWVECGRVLLLTTFCGAVFLAWKWWRRRGAPDHDQNAFALVWSVFALVLLSKLGLAPRIWHYGFFLAMPAAVFTVWLVLHRVPSELKRFSAEPRVFRVAVTLLLLIGMARLVAFSDQFYRKKDYPVTHDADRIQGWNMQSAPTGFAFDQAAAWMRENLSPTNTLAAVPDGVLINYLARLQNPTPYTIFTPSELEVYGETNMIDAFARHRPDFILIVHREFGDWNRRHFGHDRGNGYDLMQWIDRHYSPVWLLGREPLQTNLFGMKLLQRNEP